MRSFSFLLNTPFVVLGLRVLGLNHRGHRRRINGLPLDVLTVNGVLGVSVLLLLVALHCVLRVLLVEDYLPWPELRLLLFLMNGRRTLHNDVVFLARHNNCCCWLDCCFLWAGLRRTVAALDDLILLIAHLLLRTGSQSFPALILLQLHLGWTLIDVIQVCGALPRWMCQLKS